MPLRFCATKAMLAAYMGSTLDDSQQGKTMLHGFADAGHVLLGGDAVIDMCLAAGLDIDGFDRNGQTALFRSLWSGKVRS